MRNIAPIASCIALQVFTNTNLSNRKAGASVSWLLFSFRIRLYQIWDPDVCRCCFRLFLCHRAAQNIADSWGRGVIDRCTGFVRFRMALWNKLVYRSCEDERCGICKNVPERQDRDDPNYPRVLFSSHTLTVEGVYEVERSCVPAYEEYTRTCRFTPQRC